MLKLRMGLLSIPLPDFSRDVDRLQSGTKERQEREEGLHQNTRYVAGSRRYRVS